MRQILGFFILVTLIGCTDTNTESQSSIVVAAQSGQQAEPFVILELFTSEGCSDCPDAERYLNEIALKSWADRDYIYALSFHVDYWNKLGWQDIFSKRSFSDRQRGYRTSLGNEVVYTPQLIINGQEDYVGTDREKIQPAIEKALQNEPKVYFTITPNESWSSVEIDPISISENVDAERYDIHLAIVERGLSTDVLRGENEGEKLDHENIVRQFQSQKWDSKKMDITLTHDNVLTEKFSLIVFIQDPETKEIIGANIWNY
jgi:hypothetical protein